MNKYRKFFCQWDECCFHSCYPDKVEDSINFLVIGDWGGLPTSPFTTEIEKAVSKQMAKFVVHNNITFVLALGDNFYYDGVKDVHDARFQVQYYF